MGSQRVGHDWVTSLHFSILDWKKNSMDGIKWKLHFSTFMILPIFFFYFYYPLSKLFYKPHNTSSVVKSQEACTSDEIFNGLTQRFTHSWNVSVGLGNCMEHCSCDGIVFREEHVEITLPYQ